VVFTAENDLWLAPVEGGTARRLTTHVGTELYAQFSPDGRWIAFTGSYDGNGDVFVVLADGGEPRRMTWHPSPDQVIGWTPDGEHMLFRSSRENPHGSWELFMVRSRGGDAERLPQGSQPCSCWPAAVMSRQPTSSDGDPSGVGVSINVDEAVQTITRGTQ
jgi:tricorn protease